MTARSKQELLQTAIAELRRTVPIARGVMIASLEGLPIAQTSFASAADAERVAAMAATALGLGNRLNDTLGIGELNEVSVSGEQGQVYIYATGRRGALAVVAPASMNLGVLHMEAQKTAQRIAAIL